MTIVRRRRDPRTRGQQRADIDLLARFERGEALGVPPARAEESVRRVSARNTERRRRVARLGMRLAELRRSFGLTQEEVARAIGTSKPNVCAIERGRAPGISLERFLAVLETLESRAPDEATRRDDAAGPGATLSPTQGFRSPAECLEEVR